MRLRVGVIGLGQSWERWHKSALMRLSDRFELRAVCDEVAQRARLQAAELECDVVEGFTRLIERDDIEAIYLLGNSWYGTEPLRVACRAGKAVYCGRLLGPDWHETKEAVAAVQGSGIRFMAEFPWRFYPATARLMELLASGMGNPVLLVGERRTLGPPKGQPSSEASNGEPTDIAQHFADWCRFVSGRDPTSVQAVAGPSSVQASPHSLETWALEFGEDCLAEINVFCMQQAKWAEAEELRGCPSFQVAAEHGVVVLDLPGRVTWYDASGRHEESLETERSLGELLSEHFYRIVVHGLDPSPGLSDVLWAQAVLREAWRSVKEGRRILLGADTVTGALDEATGR